MPGSPVSRAASFPLALPHFTGYQASPLQRALTPPSANDAGPRPFPSVESDTSTDAPTIFDGDGRPLGPPSDSSRSHELGLSDSSPSFSAATPGPRPAYTSRQLPVQSQSQQQQQPPQEQQPQPQPQPHAAPAKSDVQIYCAACRGVARLADSYACTECVCGVCAVCVDVLVRQGPTVRRGCPRCGVVGGRFRLFQLDLR
jgi:hypothetical protein